MIRRLGLLIIVWMAIAQLVGCAGPEVLSRGALVSIYKPNSIKEGLLCSAGGKNSIAYMYVGSDTVTGNGLTASERYVIAQHARAVIGETKFISPVTMRETEGEYPVLSIHVQRFSANTSRRSDRYVTKGVFYAGFSIRQAGMIECSTAAPILVEKTWETPVYKRNSIPSPLFVKETVVKEAVRRVIRQLVPVKSDILRPVKTSGEMASNTAEMINNGNCSEAYDILSNYVKNPSLKDADAIYNAGVAAECMAGADNSMAAQAKDMQKALKCYKRAARLKPGDPDINRAVGEVSYTVKTLRTSMKNQITTGGFRQRYTAPEGF